MNQLYEWHKYKIQGVNSKTNRKKTVRILAKDEIEAEDKLIEMGIIEPYEWEEEDFDEPTERQISYAMDLGIIISPKMTRHDVSCLIDIKVDNDIYADSSLKDYAYDKNIYFSDCIGEKRLFNLIFSTLNPKDKTEFFCFTVYKYLAGYEDFNPETCPHYADIKKFAEMYYFDNSFQKSMDNYQGEDLRFFGTENDGEDFVQYGGSKKTKAYKIAKDFWMAKGITKAKKSSNSFSVNTNLDNISIPNDSPSDFSNEINNLDNQNTGIPDYKTGFLTLGVILLILLFLFS